MWASDVIIVHFEDELKDENYQQAFIMHGDFQYRITQIVQRQEKYCKCWTFDDKERISLIQCREMESPTENIKCQKVRLFYAA